MKNKKLLMLVVLSSLSGTALAVVPEFPLQAPEIDPASIGSAATLLIGGLTVLKSRFSRK